MAIVLEQFRIALQQPDMCLHLSRGQVITDPALIAQINNAGPPSFASGTVIVKGPFALNDTFTITVGGHAVTYIVTNFDLTYQTGLAGSDQSVSRVSGQLATAMNADATVKTFVTSKVDTVYGGVKMTAVAAGPNGNTVTLAASTTSTGGACIAQSATLMGGQQSKYITADTPALDEELSKPNF